VPDALTNRELLFSVARTSLRTKLQPELADQMTDAVVSAVQCIAEADVPIDLHMVEIMTMQHKLQVNAAAPPLIHGDICVGVRAELGSGGLAAHCPASFWRC